MNKERAQTKYTYISPLLGYGGFKKGGGNLFDARARYFSLLDEIHKREREIEREAQKEREGG